MNSLNEEQIKQLVSELKGEYSISPFFKEEVLITATKEAIYSINSRVDGVDFIKDFEARTLIKNYVKYSLNNLKDEFRIRYEADYIALQIKYAT